MTRNDCSKFRWAAGRVWGQDRMHLVLPLLRPVRLVQTTHPPLGGILLQPDAGVKRFFVAFRCLAKQFRARRGGLPHLGYGRVLGTCLGPGFCVGTFLGLVFHIISFLCSWLNQSTGEDNPNGGPLASG